MPRSTLPLPPTFASTTNEASVDTFYVIAVMTDLNCGVEVLCPRTVEPDSPGEHGQTYSTAADCIAARNRL
jgi:hypothetical protein